MTTDAIKPHSQRPQEEYAPNRGKIVVRKFDFDLHQSACDRLHKICPMGRSVQFHMAMSDHSARAKYRDNYHCFVAEGTTEEQASKADGVLTSEGMVLVGTFSCAVLPWTVSGKPIKAGSSFDLRVHPAFRQQGVASLLGAKLVETLKEEGCDFIVGQTVATSPFLDSKVLLGGKTEKHHYNTISWPACKISYSLSRWLFSQSPPPSLVRCLKGKDAERFLLHNCNKGLGLGDLGTLTKEKSFEGTFVATRNDSVASISLFSLRHSHSYVVSAMPATLRLGAKVYKWLTGVSAPELNKPFFVTIAFGMVQQGPDSEELLREVLAEASSAAVDEEAPTLLYCMVPSREINEESFKALVPTRLTSSLEMIMGVKMLSNNADFEWSDGEQWLIDPRPW